MIFLSFASDIARSTAGPDQLAYPQSGLLNLLVKEDKGNMYRIMLEEALVVPVFSHKIS
jgi:hypothetical protein